MIKKDDEFVDKVCIKSAKNMISLFYALGLEDIISVTFLEQTTGDTFELTLKKL